MSDNRLDTSIRMSSEVRDALASACNKNEAYSDRVAKLIEATSGRRTNIHCPVCGELGDRPFARTRPNGEEVEVRQCQADDCNTEWETPHQRTVTEN